MTTPMTDPNASRPHTAWYNYLYWLLFVPVIAIGFWVVHVVRAPTESVSVPKQNLQDAGPNLLTNPAFAYGPGGWTVYHNNQAMSVSFPRQHGGGAVIALAGAKNSAQELIQPVDSDAPSLVMSGTISISGAPLPADARVNVMIVDASNVATTPFAITPDYGVGKFPFRVGVKPNGSVKQFAIAVMTSGMSNNKTSILIRNLNLAELSASKP